jgi:periplasmic copper chaperone A
MSRYISALSLALLLAAGAVQSDETKQGDLLIDHPWARPSAGPAKTGAAYLRIVNSGATADKLIGAATPAAKRAELHMHEHADGVMRMREVKTVEVPARGEVAFKPGGLHVMLFDLEKPLREGLGFPLTLTFEKAGKVEVTVQIEKPGTAQQTGHQHPTK